MGTSTRWENVPSEKVDSMIKTTTTVEDDVGNYHVDAMMAITKHGLKQQ